MGHYRLAAHDRHWPIDGRAPRSVSVASVRPSVASRRVALQVAAERQQRGVMFDSIG